MKYMYILLAAFNVFFFFFYIYIFIVKFAKDYNVLHVKCLSSLEYIYINNFLYTIFLAFFI